MFLYELHTHTKQSSKCALIGAKEQVEYYHSIGYDGVCITDHFLTGNTPHPRYLSYNERIRRFMQSYYIAKETGDKLGIKVFFGWEYGHGGMDLLTYGLDEKWLLDNPHIMDITTSEYCNLVRESGGFIVHAHPFREASYIDHIRLFPRHVDAVEVLNASRTDFENDMAKFYADSYDLPYIYASDNHKGERPRLGAMTSDKEMKTIEDIINGIRNREFTPQVLYFDDAE
ncbi:MAG: histidinol phosphatase [Eubacteriales bacterium]|nr:histidinol phosphatase [Eubacteriales bacterium]